MDHDAEGANVLRVTGDGVTVEKGFEAEEFPVPAIKFVISSDRDEPVTVRIEDDIPPDFPMDGVGFHPDYHADQWTAYKDHRVEFTDDVDPGETLVTVYGIRVGSMAEVEPFLSDPDIEEVIPISEDLEGGPSEDVEDDRLMADIVSEDSSQLVRDFLSGKSDTIPGLGDMMGERAAADQQPGAQAGPADDEAETDVTPSADTHDDRATPVTRVGGDEPITPAAPGAGAAAGEEPSAPIESASETTASDTETEPDIDMSETPEDDPAIDESHEDDDMDDLSMGDADAESLLGGLDDSAPDEEEPVDSDLGDADSEPTVGASEDDIADAIDLGLDDADDMVVAESDVEPEGPADDVSVDIGDGLDDELGTVDDELGTVDDELGTVDDELGGADDEDETPAADDIGVDVDGAPDLDDEESVVDAGPEDTVTGESDTEEDIEFEDVAGGDVAESLGPDDEPEAPGEVSVMDEDGAAERADADGEARLAEAGDAADSVDEDTMGGPADSGDAMVSGLDAEPETAVTGDSDAKSEAEARDTSADGDQLDDTSEPEPADAETDHEEPTPEGTPGVGSDLSGDESVASALASEIREGSVDAEDLDELRAALGTTDPGSEESGSLEARVQHLDARMSELSAYTSALEEFLDEHGGGQELIDRLDETVERMDGELDSIRKTADGHGDQLHTVEGEVESLESTVEEVRSTAESTKDSLEDLQSDVESIQKQVEEIDILAGDLEAMDERLADIEEWRAQLGEMFK